MTRKLLLLIMLLLTVQVGYSQEVTPMPIITVAPEMETPPSDCGILAESMAIDPLIQRAIGAWPLWVALPNWIGDTRGILHIPNEHTFTDERLEGWWTTKVAWFISNAYTDDVQLQGFHVEDHSPIYFEFSDHELREVAILNPAEPGAMWMH
jgi:hypothetical protein